MVLLLLTIFNKENSIVDIEKSKKASQLLIKYLKMYGSEEENIPESRIISDANGYKITYRICSLFIAPTLSFLEEVLNNEIPTKEESLAITKNSDTFLAELLKDKKVEDTFFHNYDFIFKAWQD